VKRHHVVVLAQVLQHLVAACLTEIVVAYPSLAAVVEPVPALKLFLAAVTVQS
jgi:hypothetical protein